MKDSDRADLSARACGVVIDSDGFGCCGGVDADGVEDAAAGFDSGRGLACDVGVFEGKNCLLRSPESLCLNFGPKTKGNDDNGTDPPEIYDPLHGTFLLEKTPETTSNVKAKTHYESLGPSAPGVGRRLV